MNKKQDRTRISAQERREAIIDAAVQEFASKGLAGSSTQAISNAVGVSQPYLFKLFGTKTALFLAAYDRVSDRIHQTLEDAAAAQPEDPHAAMDEAYRALLGRRDDPLLLLQAYAAAGDEEVRAHIRQREAQTFAEVVEMFDGDANAARQWLALGLLEAVGAILNLPEYRE